MIERGSAARNLGFSGYFTLFRSLNCYSPATLRTIAE